MTEEDVFREHRRDPGLIRDILLCMERGDDRRHLAKPDPDRFRYHIRLMIEAGLIEGNVVRMGEGYAVMVEDPAITNRGHDLLDAIRADNVWRKVSERLLTVGGSIAVDLLIQLAKNEAAKLLGLPPDT
jgi:hypothetical protein